MQIPRFLARLVVVVAVAASASACGEEDSSADSVTQPTTTRATPSSTPAADPNEQLFRSLVVSGDANGALDAALDPNGQGTLFVYSDTADLADQFCTKPYSATTDDELDFETENSWLLGEVIPIANSYFSGFSQEAVVELARASVSAYCVDDPPYGFCTEAYGVKCREVG